MAEIVNLRQAKKRRARDEKRREADGNAARHGRTKAEREAETLQSDLAARRLSGHLIEDDASATATDPDAARNDGADD